MIFQHLLPFNKKGNKGVLSFLAHQVTGPNRSADAVIAWGLALGIHGLLGALFLALGNHTPRASSAAPDSPGRNHLTAPMRVHIKVQITPSKASFTDVYHKKKSETPKETQPGVPQQAPSVTPTLPVSFVAKTESPAAPSAALPSDPQEQNTDKGAPKTTAVHGQPTLRIQIPDHLLGQGFFPAKYHVTLTWNNGLPQVTGFLRADGPPLGGLDDALHKALQRALLEGMQEGNTPSLRRVHTAIYEFKEDGTAR